MNILQRLFCIVIVGSCINITNVNCYIRKNIMAVVAFRTTVIVSVWFMCTQNRNSAHTKPNTSSIAQPSQHQKR